MKSGLAGMRWASVSILPFLLASLSACGSVEPSDEESTIERSRQSLVRENFVNIDLEDTASVSGYPNNPYLNDDDKSFPLELEGSALGPAGPANAPYISSSVRFAGARALQLTLPPRSDPTASDRAEVSAFHMGFEETYGIPFKFGHSIYFGFAMYIHGSSDVLDGGVHFMQAWQANCEPCGVPLVATLMENTGSSASPQQFYIKTHDNAGARLIVPPRTLTRAAWHRFVFYMRPSPNNDGTLGYLKIWLDGQVLFNQAIDFGCNVQTNLPSSNPATEGLVMNEWMIRSGMYRPDLSKQDNRTLHIFYDNVRLANSLRHADPASTNLSPETP